MTSTQDERFASTYRNAWQAYRRELGDDDHAVVIRLEDDIHYLRGARSRYPVVGDRYHVLKRLAHLPVALFMETALTSDRTAAGDTVERCRDAHRKHRAGLEDHAAVIETLFQACDRYAIECSRSARPSYETVRELTDAVYVPVNDLVRAAALEEVRRLHDVIARLEEATPAPIWGNAYFAVVGGVQPRYKELSKMYLTRYLEQSRATRGGFRHRVVYAEGEHTIDSVLNLIAKRELNRVLGETFTGSPLGLDQDVLGEAAERAIGSVLDGREAVSPG